MALSTIRGKESAILAILQDIQAKNKYLPKESAGICLGENASIPLNKILRIATFYNAFSLKPRGRHKVDVCLGTACHVRGGQQDFGKDGEGSRDISVGETTKDKRFTLESVHCVGRVQLRTGSGRRWECLWPSFAGKGARPIKGI